MRVIKTFDSLQSMGAQFGGEVFQDISDEVLYVYNRVDNEWYQYSWTQSTNRVGSHGALAAQFSFVRPGDTLVVWRLDRLGRSLKDLIRCVEELKEREVEFRSLHESIDTASPSGKLQFHIFSALAEFERDLIRERTLAGLKAARARGKLGGRRRSMTPEKVKLASRLMQDPAVSVDEICRTLRVSRATL